MIFNWFCVLYKMTYAVKNRVTFCSHTERVRLTRVPFRNSSSIFLQKYIIHFPWEMHDFPSVYHLISFRSTGTFLLEKYTIQVPSEIHYLFPSEVHEKFSLRNMIQFPFRNTSSIIFQECMKNLPWDVQKHICNFPSHQQISF